MDDVMVRERYELSKERLGVIMLEETVKEPYRDYFRKTAEFLLMLDEVQGLVRNRDWESADILMLAEENRKLYEDILPEQYETSYGNPAYAQKMLGETFGSFLSALYSEMRSGIVYAYEGQLEYLSILNELFIEIYNCFEEEPEYQAVRDIFYWYANDYCEVFAADRILDQIDPDRTFAVDIICRSDLSDQKYLYRYGEYISDNEIETAKYIADLPEETIQKMADVYTEGFRKGFVLGNKDLSKKTTVNIRFKLGFERVVKQAVANFEAMGLRPTIYRAGASVLTRRGVSRNGYFGRIPNQQYDYDHKDDQALFLDKHYVERRLEVMKTVYEQNKELAAGFAGPAVMEVFGEIPFAPQKKEEALTLTKKQEEMLLSFDGKAGQITNTYIPGDERSFTIISWPVPEIGEKFEEIFGEVIRINTLDSDLYSKVQQTMIDALDEGESVHILGSGENRTDLTVQLYRLQDPQKETIFENCVADVNIPVGEVFTSPVLRGTNGVLHVSRVYLNGLQYRDLEIRFQDGMISGYGCGNFEDEKACRDYVKENILFNHETLPLGEFAIGTNTTAYVAGRRFGIEDKYPILIAEKTGPHFAVGDTCYSYSEDTKVYNPDGKEIVARDNEVSILRKENPEQAYMHCHTDITIPYDELGAITVIRKDGSEIPLLKDGRFVLPGTEILNEPLDCR